MTDETVITEKPAKIPKQESHLFGLSVRAIITLSLVWTVCYMAVTGIEVKEPLYTLVGMVAAYYFGQNVNQRRLTKEQTT